MYFVGLDTSMTICFEEFGQYSLKLLLSINLFVLLKKIFKSSFLQKYVYDHKSKKTFVYILYIFRLTPQM